MNYTTPIISRSSRFWIKTLRPKTKLQQLDAYVMTHDILTADYLISIGITRHSRSIAGIERRCKVEIQPINKTSWWITK